MSDLQRWLSLCERAGAKGDAAAVYARLAERYAEPHRACHTLDHIAFCLDEFEPVRHLATWPNEVEMAIWFHDAVYAPAARDNEARSAEVARQACAEMKLPKAFGKRVFHFIIATQHHVVPSDPDARLIGDVDLAILGQPADRFDDYERRIRQEHAHVAANDFRAARAAILRDLLARPHVYSTEHFRERYEAQARANLERALARPRP